jgi:hypothetical protein
MAHGLITRPLHPDFFVSARKGFGYAELDRTDAINRNLEHFWNFADKGSALSDLAGRALMQKHADHSWESTPRGRGLTVASNQEGTGGPTLNVGTGDFSVVLNFWLTSIPGSFPYYGEFGAYSPGFRASFTGVWIPTMYWGGANDFTDLEFDSSGSMRLLHTTVALEPTGWAGPIYL